MRKLIIALLLLLLGGGGMVGIEQLGSSREWNKFEKPTPIFSSASTTATQIIALNYNRQYLKIINIGTSTAWIWLNSSTDGVVVNQGIPLLPLTTTTPDLVSSSYEINSVNLYFGPIQDIAENYSRLFIIEK